jgi:hypothetical protein
MKKINLLILITALTVTNAFSQGKVKIFNTTLKVKDIIGTTNVAQQKWNRELDQVLVRNNEFYFKTIGSYRDDYMSDEPHSLFNLIDKGSYPLLDEINMKYYEEVVLPNLKSDLSVKQREDFVKFCIEWDKLSGFAERKSLLFKNEFIDIGKVIQSKRFTITSAPFDLSKTVTKKFNSTVSADIKANLKANNIDASASLVNYLSSTVTSQTVYKGTMLIVEFEDDYMTRLNLALNGVSTTQTGNDNFSKALRDYAAPGSVRAATTGLVVFKLDGKINKTKLTEESLKADLKGKFKSLDDGKIADIAAAISIGFVSKVESTFSAEIDNIYIKNLLTSQRVDEIELNKIFNTFK